jgi:hypothetical protein
MKALAEIEQLTPNYVVMAPSVVSVSAVGIFQGTIACSTALAMMR